MSEAYVGEIRIVAFTFPPRGWAFCNGQLLAIQQNQALFSILGTTYGGNGVQTFALPDLRGRVPVNFGQSTIGSFYNIGETGGEENHQLLQSEMPLHNHIPVASTAAANVPAATGNFWAADPGSYAAAANTTMLPNAIGTNGGNQPHPNLAPYLVVNFCIALSGLFPSRN
ncbi:MAG: tail fiber protein [Acidobacteriota bacterium]